MRICDIVAQVLQAGVLSIEAEEDLRSLMLNKYDREDFQAFMRLQEAAMSGKIDQESRQHMKRQVGSQGSQFVECVGRGQ
jgi:hypothetical protein